MRSRSASRDRVKPPPVPVFFSKQQMGMKTTFHRKSSRSESSTPLMSPSGDYLQDLRTNVPSRPSGARAPPTSFVAQRRALFDNSVDAAKAKDSLGAETPEPSPKCTTFQETRRPSAAASDDSTRGRPLVRGPNDPPKFVDVGQEKEGLDDEPFIPYTERGARWMEKQEVRSVSQALRDMDLKDEERLFKAAQTEASELVWKHQNPNAPYRNPDEKPYDYHAHLRKGSHARSMSRMRELSMSKRRRDGSSSWSVSNGSKSSRSTGSRVPSDGSSKAPASPITPVEDCFGDELRDPAKATVHFADPSPEKKRRKITPPQHDAPKPDEDIKISNLAIAARMVSNAAPVHFRNPFARAKQAKTPQSRVDSAPVTGLGKWDKVEIQRNPPTQSRNPTYTMNGGGPIVPIAVAEDMKMKHGKEIRSDDIRKATSMSLKDRSPKLPTPTMVSDSPNRPIVSFHKDWRPKEVQLQAIHADPERTPSPLDLPDPVMKRSQTEPTPKVYPPAPAIPIIAVEEPVTRSPTVPVINVSNKPPIPTIAINSDVPSISVNPSIPIIAVNDTPSISVSAPTIAINDVPTISVTNAPTISISSADSTSSTRPLPTPANQRKYNSIPTTIPGSGTALCASCALPISGRIVTASGSRFHPQCFTCHTCGEHLECVAFYPEPPTSRSDRLLNPRSEVDSDPSPRFYCHLDYHELFSPRCKSCKTPIEGAVIVACGASWHEGHFFCAECGDPFTAEIPFVERDGYAWCVGCCAKRYSGKCKRCRRPILETVVSALGAEWHEECFCCAVSYLPFASPL